MSISAENRAQLIALARAAIEAQVCGKSVTVKADLSGVLGEKRGCFVTLTRDGQLRGCIGTFQPRQALGRTIIEMGKAAATDPRFTWDPITPGEIPQLTLEVSVLSPLEKTDAPESLQVGVHGIYIIAGSGAGCFLPEVATDMGWDAVTFLDQCCTHKAGLPAGAWRQPDAAVYLFTSEKFDH
jgi:AmmeMemoRadiSam system protein A